MTAEELRQALESEIAKLSKEDRVLWLRFTATTPTRASNEECLVWRCGSSPVRELWIGYRRDPCQVVVYLPTTEHTQREHLLPSCEAAARYVVDYLRERYAYAKLVAQ